MAPTHVPDGFVFVPGRSADTARALLDAADTIKADRKLSVRTVTSGYHVTAEVAEEYQKAFPGAQVEEPDSGETDEGDGDEPAALPVTADSTHAEIDEYASSLDPAVTFPKDTNKADKIALLEQARTPGNTAE